MANSSKNSPVKTVMNEIKAWMRSIVSVMPGRLGYYMRARLVNRALKRTVNGLKVGPYCELLGLQNMDLGDHVSISPFCVLASEGGRLKIGAYTSMNYHVFIGADHSEIEIGRNVLIGPGVIFRAANHKFENYDPSQKSIRQLGHEGKKIKVGDNVWIGANAVILPGVEIGSNAVIAAGAVVAKDVPSGELAAGVPAKKLRALSLEGAATRSLTPES